jgi:hypothetical protein
MNANGVTQAAASQSVRAATLIEPDEPSLRTSVADNA